MWRPEELDAWIEWTQQLLVRFNDFNEVHIEVPVCIRCNECKYDSMHLHAISEQFCCNTVHGFSFVPAQYKLAMDGLQSLQASDLNSLGHSFATILLRGNILGFSSWIIVPEFCSAPPTHNEAGHVLQLHLAVIFFWILHFGHYCILGMLHYHASRRMFALSWLTWAGTMLQAPWHAVWRHEHEKLLIRVLE